MIETVLLAIDGSTHAEQGIKLAAEIAAAFHARLHIVHVMLRNASGPFLSKLAERMPFTRDLGRRIDNFALSADPDIHAAGGIATAFIPLCAPQELLNDVGDEIVAIARQQARDIAVERVTTSVLAGDVADAILDCAQAEHADLIVLGSRGLGDFKSLMLGSVSHKVTAGATCGVLVAR